MQLVVLGYAFGRKSKGVRVAVVDEDCSTESRELRERFAAITAGPKTFRINTLLFFPSGAIYPTEGFPFWLKWISVVDPFT